MLYRCRLFAKLVLLSLLVAGFSAPVLAQPGPGDKNRSGSDGAEYGWDVANGSWWWFSHVELVDIARLLPSQGLLVRDAVRMVSG
jgi:hypothetical protein